MLKTSETIEALAVTGTLPKTTPDAGEQVETETDVADTDADTDADTATDPTEDSETTTSSESPDASPEPKLIVTDPQMRALTQPLVSSETAQPSRAASTDAADKQSIRLSSNHDADMERSPAQFRETGQWFVESVEELEAVNPHLSDLDDLGVPKDRNLLPWVLGILTVLVVAILAFWEEPEEPAWKAKLRTAKQTTSAQKEAKAPKEGKPATAGTAATSENSKAKEEPATQGDLAALARRAM